MTETIKGSVVLITGATGAIAQALITALEARGAAKIYAAARDISGLTASARRRAARAAAPVHNGPVCDTGFRDPLRAAREPDLSAWATAVRQADRDRRARGPAADAFQQ